MNDPFELETVTGSDWSETLKIERNAEALLIKVQALEILLNVPGVPLDYALRQCGFPALDVG